MEKIDKYGNDHFIQCFRSCDQQPRSNTKTKGRIFIKTEFNSQKNISLLQNGRGFHGSLLQHGPRDVM